jgi:hypothetical protein
LVEDVVVVAVMEGVVDWLIVAVAVNWRPVSPRGSGPLTKLKIPET